MSAHWVECLYNSGVEGPHEDVMEEIKVTIHRSAADDNALVVQIDTKFEPDGSDGGPGLRVLINDDDAYIGVPFGTPLEDLS